MASKKKPAVDPSPVVEHLLRGFSATTLFGGLRLGQTDLEVIATLGPPAEHTPEVTVGTRRLWYVNYRQPRALAGFVLQEFIDFHGMVHPTRGNRLEAVSAMLHGPVESGDLLSAAFAEMKRELATTFGVGRNKATFRAPGFDETEEGFVSVYFGLPRPPLTTVAVLKVTAGVVV